MYEKISNWFADTYSDIKYDRLDLLINGALFLLVLVYNFSSIIETYMKNPELKDIFLIILPIGAILSVIFAFVSWRMSNFVKSLSLLSILGFNFLLAGEIFEQTSVSGNYILMIYPLISFAYAFFIFNSLNKGITEKNIIDEPIAFKKALINLIILCAIFSYYHYVLRSNWAITASASISYMFLFRWISNKYFNKWFSVL